MTFVVAGGANGNSGAGILSASPRHSDTIDKDGLTLLAIAYLSLPSLIVFFGWFKAPVAVIAVAALVYSIFTGLGAHHYRFRSNHSRNSVLLIAVTAFSWAAFSGGSHFVHADHDWLIRDAVMGDLIRGDWPVIYTDIDGAPLLLRSAIGYFLPAAVFGKAFGFANIDLAIYFWTAAGALLFLLLLPLPRLFGVRLFVALGVTIFFSGMDYLGVLFATGSTPIFPLRLEWWVPLSYPSLTGQLLWAPNHALPIWIGSALIFRHRESRDFPSIAVGLLALTLVWTPFAALGLIPFVLLGFRSSLMPSKIHSLPWRTLLSTGLYAIPILLYLLADLGSVDLSTAGVIAPGPGTNIAKQAISPIAYLTFISCEFFLLSLALAFQTRSSRDFLALSVVVLLALPFFNFGPSNDALLRLSTPPLIMLLAICQETLLTKSFRQTSMLFWLVWIFLAIGAHTAFNELWRAATFRRWTADYHHTLAERQGGRPAGHYVGRLDRSLIRYLLKPVGVPIPNSLPPTTK